MSTCCRSPPTLGIFDHTRSSCSRSCRPRSSLGAGSAITGRGPPGRSRGPRRGRLGASRLSLGRVGSSGGWATLAACPVGAGIGIASTLQIVLGIVSHSSTCYRLTGLPGRCRSIRPWFGPVIRRMAALLLAATVVLNLRAFRHLAARGPAASPGDRIGAAAEAGRAGLGGRRLKSMASVDRAAPGWSRAGRRAGRRRRPGGRVLSLTKPRLVLHGSGDRGRRVPPGGAASGPRTDARDPGGDAPGHRTGGRGRRCAEPVARARAMPGCGGRPTGRFPSGRLTPSEAAIFGGLARLPGHGRAALGGEPAGGRGRLRDVRALRLRVHPAETV